jgi:hypothetical protein
MYCNWRYQTPSETHSHFGLPPLLAFRHFDKNTWDNKCIRRKYLFLFMISKVLVPRHLASSLGPGVALYFMVGAPVEGVLFTSWWPGRKKRDIDWTCARPQLLRILPPLKSTTGWQPLLQQVGGWFRAPLKPSVILPMIGTGQGLQCH